MKFFLILFTTLVSMNCFSQVFVDANATGTNNGSSWGNAYAFLQDALINSNSGDSIWVASGTYYPDEGGVSINNDKASSFIIPDGVKVFGGFSGIENSIHQRNFTNNPTILSGEIQNDNDSTNNSFVVVTLLNCGTLTELDGFTITKGYYDSTAFTGFGAGLIVKNSTANISNVKVNRNTMLVGNRSAGGVGVLNSTVIFNNLQVTKNYHLATLNPVASGGLFAYESDVEIYSGNFENNSSVATEGNTAGAIYCIGSNLRMKNSSIKSNSSYAAWTAAGIYMDNAPTSSFGYPGELIIVNTRIVNNKSLSSNAWNTGAIASSGIFTHYVDSVFIYNTLLSNNTAIANNSDYFYGNSSASSFLNYYSFCQVSNCTFASNSDQASNHYITDTRSSVVIVNDVTNIDNCISWNNTDNSSYPDFCDIIEHSGATPVITANNSLFQTYSNGSNSLVFTNPIFLSDGLSGDTTTGGQEGDYRLNSNSPCRNTGSLILLPNDKLDLDEDSDTSEVIPFDANGGIRVYECDVDMGAYEINHFLLNSTITAQSCDSYTVPSGYETYFETGLYFDTLISSTGCDSIITIDLTINNSTTGTHIINACDSYTWIDGNTYTTSNNTATHNLTNAAGCDSIVSLDLTINNSNTGTDVIIACDSYTWIDGITYTSSNNSATHMVANAVGCDSIVTLDLTIHNSASSSQNITACDFYQWPVNSTVYINSGTYTETLTTINGCDSVVTLNLTIASPQSSTKTITACDNYTWPANGNTYVSSGSHLALLQTMAGCDSIVTLDLTINYSTTGTDVITACDAYTWIDGNTYSSSNNTASHTLTNAAGCDSIVTLDLTINYSSTGTDVITACDSHTWIDGNTYTSSNNTATHILTNAAGCDSIVSLDLTINNSNTGTDEITACDSYMWIDGNTYTTSNNTATHNLTNAAGCDSVVTLDLTIVSVTDITTSLSGTTITVTNTNATYQWLDCDNNYSIISGETNQSFAATSNGNYAAELTENGCVDTSACVSVTTVGIDKLGNTTKVLAFPNPSTGAVQVTFQETVNNVELILTDVQGKTISKQEFSSIKDTNIELESSGGVYFLTIKTSEGQNTIKLIKE